MHAAQGNAAHLRAVRAVGAALKVPAQAAPRVGDARRQQQHQQAASCGGSSVFTAASEAGVSESALGPLSVAGTACNRSVAVPVAELLQLFSPIETAQRRAISARIDSLILIPDVPGSGVPCCGWSAVR